MTKRRDPLTDHHTLTVVAAQLGWDRCASILGVTERAVRNWGDPDCETEIRRIDAERLDKAYLAAGGDHAPFHRLHGLRIELAERERADANLTTLAGTAAKETGEAIQALLEAAHSDDPEVRRRAQQELQEAIGTLTDGLAAIERADSPVRVVK